MEWPGKLFQRRRFGDPFLAEPSEKERSQPCEDQGLVDSGKADNSRQTKDMYTDPKLGKMRFEGSDNIYYDCITGGKERITTWERSGGQGKTKQVQISQVKVPSWIQHPARDSK